MVFQKGNTLASCHKGRIPWNKGIQQWKDKEHPRSMKGKKHTFEARLKISNSLKGEKNHFYGKKHSVQSRSKISQALIRGGKAKGENNSMWRGGISKEKYNNNVFIDKLKDEIRIRDNHCCVICLVNRDKISRKMDTHHINYDKTCNLKENLISLCRTCHSKTNINREIWQQFFQSMLSKKYNYKYSEDRDIIIELGNESK